METVNIVIIGFPNAGKSTITNSLMGTNYSKVNTQIDSVFTVGSFDRYESEEEVNNNIENGYSSTLPYPENCNLSKEWNYTISDLVGIVKSSEHKRTRDHPSIKYVDDNKSDTDFLIVVFDIHKFEDDKTKNLGLLQTVSKKLENPSKILIVLNKCDSVVASEHKTIFTNKEEHEKFKKCEELLKLKGYNDVIALCATNSLRISAGDNNIFDDEYQKECYCNEKEHNNSSSLLVKYGFNKLVSHINNFVETNKNKLISKHVMCDMLGGEYSDFKSITYLLNRLKEIHNNEDTTIASHVATLVSNHIDVVKNSQDSINSLENIKKEFYELSTKYNDMFNLNLDPENRFENMMKDMEVKCLVVQLKQCWNPDIIKQLYEKNELTSDLLFESAQKHVNEDNLIKVVSGMSTSTYHDPKVLCDILCAFVSQNMSYIVPFKNGATIDPVFDWIIAKLLHDYGSEYEYQYYNNLMNDYDKYEKTKNMFTSLNNLFKHLAENKIVKVSTINTNDFDSSETNSSY